MMQISRFTGLAAAIAVAVTLLAPSAASAQNMPLDKAVVSSDVASRTLMKMQVNATVARQIVDACLDFARTPSSVVASRFPTLEGRAIRMDLGKETGLSYYFVGGGLPIVVENNLIGSIGVGGGNMDEQCAYSALTKVLGPQPPLPVPNPPAAGAAPGAGGGRGGRGGQPQ